MTNSSLYKIFLLIAFVGILFSANAQTFVATGKVIDANNEPVPGVNVIVVNDQDRFVNGTTTNFDGEYKIGMGNREHKLVFSFIGFKTQSVSVEQGTVFNITLIDAVEELEEVFVTAAKRSEDAFSPVAMKDLATAVDRIEMSSMEDVPAVSLGDALQGQMANMDIVSASGEPGAGMSIRIRGTTSLNASSNPLFVVDGIIYDTNIDDDFDFAVANEEDYGSLVSLPPEDIESIQLLKDGGATAIWGSRGANGVILIKTKRGRKGKTRVSYSFKLSLNREPEQIPMLTGDQFVSYMQEAYWNNYFTEGWAVSAGLANTLNNGIDELSYNPNYQYFDEYNQNTNWLNEVSQDAVSHSHNLSVSGGGDKALYRLSFGYADEEGTTVGTDLERFTTLWNIDYRVSNKLTLSSDFSLAHSIRGSNYQLAGEPRQRALMRMPNVSPYYIDENGDVTNNYFQRESDWQGTSVGGYYNAVALVDESFNNTLTDRVRTSLKLKYHIFDPLSFQFDVGFDYNTSKNQRFLPQSVTGVSWVNTNSNRAVEGSSESFVINTTSRIVYRPDIGEDHQVTGVLALMTFDRTNNSYQGVVSGLGSVYAADPSSEGQIRSIGSGSSQNRSVATIANGHYMFRNKYIISGGVNFEGNSKFGGSKRWGAFPNIALAWRLSDEEFMQSIGFLNELKVRGSYGENGNPPNTSYGYFGTYASAGQYMDMDAISPNSIQLDNLKWETVTQTNLGIDFNGFNNNLEMHAELYRKTTNDMLQPNAIVPSITGYSKISLLNYGTMRNSGWEFSGNVTLLRKNGWRVRFNWNLAQNINEVLDMPDNVPLEQYTFNNGNYASRIEIGNPLGSFYGYEFLGVYPDKESTIVLGQDGSPVYGLDGQPVYMSANDYTFQAGDAKYNDTNFDGVINEYDMIYLGDAMPSFTGGFGPYVSYKGFALNMFFHFRTGQYVVNNTRMNLENMYGKNNQSAAVLSRWRQPGDVTEVPRALYNTGYNWLGSSRFVEESSYLRLKITTLSYTIPKDITEKLKMNRIKMFITGYDLLTFTNYSGQDPEVSVGGSDPFRLGYDNSRTPRPQRYTFGFNVEF